MAPGNTYSHIISMPITKEITSQTVYCLSFSVPALPVTYPQFSKSKPVFIMFHCTRGIVALCDTASKSGCIEQLSTRARGLPYSIRHGDVTYVTVPGKLGSQGCHALPVELFPLENEGAWNGMIHIVISCVSFHYTVFLSTITIIVLVEYIYHTRWSHFICYWRGNNAIYEWVYRSQHTRTGVCICGHCLFCRRPPH